MKKKLKIYLIIEYSLFLLLALYLFKVKINPFSYYFASLAYFVISNSILFLINVMDNGVHNTPISYLPQIGKNLSLSYLLSLLLYYCYIYLNQIFFMVLIILIYFIKDFVYTNIKEVNSITQIVESFLKVIDYKDHYTEGHCERVARYTRILCHGLGINKNKIECFVNIAKIHDIGKISIPDKIIKSSSLLTDDEYDEIKKHSYYGYQLLKDIDLLNKDLKILLYHHEHYDGTGYPEGRMGSEIPLGSRILSVCDAFDVMTYGRNYKPAMDKKEIIQEFKDCAGTQFDPVITEKMIELINNDQLNDTFPEKKEKISTNWLHQAELK